MTLRTPLLAMAPLLAALLATPLARADLPADPPPPAPPQPDPAASQPQSPPPPTAAPPPSSAAPSSTGREAGGCALGTGPAEEGAVGASLLLLAVGLAAHARRAGRR